MFSHNISNNQNTRQILNKLDFNFLKYFQHYVLRKKILKILAFLVSEVFVCPLTECAFYFTVSGTYFIELILEMGIIIFG